jgi:hypothetical protein
VFWLAETNRRDGALVSIELDLALAVGVFYIFKVFKGQRLVMLSL